MGPETLPSGLGRSGTVSYVKKITYFHKYFEKYSTLIIKYYLKKILASGLLSFHHLYHVFIVTTASRVCPSPLHFHFHRVPRFAP